MLPITRLIIYTITLISLFIAIDGLVFMSEEQQPNQITKHTPNAFINYLKTCPYYKISMLAINAVISFTNDNHIHQYQQIINDLSLYSNSLISNNKSTTTNTTTTANHHHHHRSSISKIYTKMVMTNCSESIISISIHTECFPFNSSQFYFIFLLFSHNTHATYTMMQRITLYTFIQEQVMIQ